jgi:hypothetical protein
MLLQSQGQEQGTFQMSGSLVLGNDMGINGNTQNLEVSYGLNLGMAFFLFDRISLGPSFTAFLPYNSALDSAQAPSSGREASVQHLIVNFDSRIYAGETLFLLLGYNYMYEDVEGERFTGSGANLGMGLSYEISRRVSSFGQFKYQTTDDGQFVLNLGATINL